MESLMVKTIMRPAEIAIKKGVTLDIVSDHLTQYALPGLPVVDDEGTLVGYVSEYDCLKQLMQSTYYCDNTSLVEDVMSTTLITGSAELSVLDIASKMNTDKVNVLPLVDARGKFVGCVSRGDVMRALVKELESCNLPS